MSGKARPSQIFFLVTFLVTLYIFYLMLKPFLVSVILAITLASLFYPSYRRLRQRLGGRSNLSALLMCFVVTFLIIIPLAILFMALANEVNSVYNTFRFEQTYLSGLLASSDSTLMHVFREWVSRYLDLEIRDLPTFLSSLVDRMALYLLDHYSAILGGVGTLLLNFLVIVFGMFFFFRDGNLLIGEIKQLIPLAPRYADMVFHKLKLVTHATFFGIFAAALVQGLIAGIVFLILGISSPILWGTATAVFSLIPVVGTATIWVPMAIYLMSTGSLVRGIILITVGGSLIGLVDNVLRPWIIEDRPGGMPLLLVFFAMAGGLLLFGPAGLVLGPLVAALLVTLVDIYKIEYRQGGEPAES